MQAMTDRNRWIALYVLCAGVLMIVLDVTIVNVALPSIKEDLGFTQSGLAWVVNAYLIAFGGLLLPAGRIGDLVGRLTMFPEPRDQAKAIGVYGFVASGGGTVGLLAGGILTQAINWHWIFFVNLPIGLATAVYTRRLVERDTGIGLSAGAD